MNFRIKAALFAAVGLLLVLLAAAACQSDQPVDPGASGQTGNSTGDGSTPEPDTDADGDDADGDDATAAQQRPAVDAVVTGTVTYRERIALSPDAVLELELRDVSLMDVSSKLIAQQVITNPGQPPIPFRIEYDRDDITAGNTYAVQARIKYRDGSLAFINDTAYEVLTGGRPSEVDMVLTLVSTPPDPDVPTTDPGLDVEWVDVPAKVRRVEIEEGGGGYVFSVVYFLRGGADCSRLSSSLAELVDVNIYLEVNILEKRAIDGSSSCATEPREGTVSMEVAGPFRPGETYRVRVNDRLTNVFTPPREGFGEPRIALSPIEDADVVVLEIYPAKYNVVVFSGLPKGSGCSQFNGFSIERSDTDRFDLLVTHHEVLAIDVGCIADYPIVETAIPLGSEFESGKEYTVVINSDTVLTFRAQ